MGNKISIAAIESATTHQPIEYHILRNGLTVMSINVSHCQNPEEALEDAQSWGKLFETWPTLFDDHKPNLISRFMFKLRCYACGMPGMGATRTFQHAAISKTPARLEESQCVRIIDLRSKARRARIFKAIAKHVGLAFLTIVIACAVLYVVGDVAYHTMFEPKASVSRD